MRLLVSVRDVAEAQLAAAAGVDFIDLKDPAAGALGGLAPEVIRPIVAALHGTPRRGRISATIGDVPAGRRSEILARVAAVAACGVDYVKVGIEPGPAAPALLAALAGCGAVVVPVLIADQGVDGLLVRDALAYDAFPALMLDTADKRGGSLVQRIGREPLQDFVDTVRRREVLCGLAGALRTADLPALRALAPDFAGFRSAVCASDRAGALDPARLEALQQAAVAGLPLPQAVS